MVDSDDNLKFGERSLSSTDKLIGRMRKEKIENMIRELGSMSIGDLAREFAVSEMTIRRDLSKLEERGQIRRTHGGAIVEPGVQNHIFGEPFFDERQNLNLDRKRRIAERAARLVQPNLSVALDVGTTTYELSQLLSSRRDTRLFTNNLRIGMMSGDYAAEIYVLGGIVRQKEMSLCGPVAVEQARKLWFDIAFIGVSGVASTGMYDYSIAETELKRIYIERSTRRVVLADSSKFGQMSLVQVGALDQIDILVTDAAPPAALEADLVAAGVQILLSD